MPRKGSISLILFGFLAILVLVQVALVFEPISEVKAQTETGVIKKPVRGPVYPPTKAKPYTSRTVKV